MIERARPARQAKPGANSRKKAPKHSLLADELLSRIEAGEWPPGEQIPSEEQIASESGMSLGTVQRALRNLAESGVVIRQHGRGTFVRGGRAPNRHLRHFRFLSEDGKSLLPIFVKVQDVSQTDEDVHSFPTRRSSDLDRKSVV